MIANRFRLSTGLLLCCVALGAAPAALAASGADKPPGASSDKTSKPDTATLPPVLQESVKAGKLTVVKQFKTAKTGIDGYVVQQNGQYQVVYGSGDYLMIGQLVSPEGNNLTADYTDKYVPKPDLAKTVDQLKKDGHLVKQGPDGAPVIYAFADPNCIYCHKLYQAVAPLAKAGRLQVQWALVGFLKPSSAGRAAAILSAKDPSAALAKNEAGFDEDAEEGGIAPLESPKPAIAQLIAERAKQMAEAGGRGTPTVLYREGANAWGMKPGMPSQDWLEAYARPRPGASK